jgi:hypothetical protein
LWRSGARAGGGEGGLAGEQTLDAPIPGVGPYQAAQRGTVHDRAAALVAYLGSPAESGVLGSELDARGHVELREDATKATIDGEARCL